VLLGLAVLVGVGRWRGRLVGDAQRQARLALAYLILLVAAIVASRDPSISLRAGSELFSFATLGLTLVFARGERRVRWLVDALILIGAAIALWGLSQFGAGFGELDNRIRGPFSHYMTFSGFLLVIALLLGARMLRRRPDGAGGPTALLDRTWLSWMAFAVITWALFASLTRGAWIALVVALAGVVALEHRRLLWWAVPATLAFMLIAPVPMLARAFSIADLSNTSNYDRLCMAEAGLRMVGERPVLGVGPDMVRRIYPLYRHPTAPRLLVPHLHNAYLQIAAERGIPALSVMLALIGSAWLAARRGYRSGGSTADLHLGVLGALTAFAVAALFEDNWGDTEVQRVVLFLLAAPFVLDHQEAADRAIPRRSSSSRAAFDPKSSGRSTNCCRRSNDRRRDFTRRCATAFSPAASACARPWCCSPANCSAQSARGPCPERSRSKRSIPTAWFTTICRLSTTTICVAVVRRCIVPSTRRRRSSSATRC
jgi:O-antigen ligase